ncbi:MAG: hypothetical protein C0397_13420 [Odoribacter sp.]|nr:hypothetical protein [Odoribacter sp.]
MSGLHQVFTSKRASDLLIRRISMNTARDIQNSTTDTLNNIQFSDIFDLNEIQRLQDLFSDATGVASIITYPDGTPITKPSNFCRLCGIIRKTEKGRANCYKSDAVIGKQNSSGPIVQPCLSGGLWDAGTSITVGGKHIANWLIGQVRNEELDEQRMIQYADEIGANREDFLEALIEVPVMSLERFKKVSEMLFAFASELSEKAYNNLQLKMQIAEREKATELLKENEERYRTLFEQSNDAIFLVDTATGNYLDANRAAEIMTGRSQNEFKGLNTHDITPKGAEKRLEKLLDANDPLEMGEVEYLRPDGTTRTAVLNTIPLRKGRAFGIAHDITKRKRVQEALLESEERFRNFVETSADLIFSLSKIGFIEYVSPRVTDLYGYEPASLIGKHLKTTTPIKEVPKAIKALKFVLSGNSLKNFQINQISKTGKIIPIEINAVPVWKAGKIIGCQGIMRDITERKHAEEALRESEKLYRSLFNNMLNGFAYCRMLYDRGQPSDFIYLGVNGAFEVQTGLRNVAGKKVSEVIPGIRESDPKLFEIYGRVASTGKPEVFEMYIAALQMWFSISVYSPAKNHFVAVFDVITERKLAEEALRISQKKYKDIIDYSPVGFYQSNMDGDIILANDRFSKILGYESAAGILNRNFVKDIFYDPSERSVLINQITGIGGSRDYELRWKKRDGVPIWVMNSIRVVKDESGNILYFEGFVQISI